MSADTTAVSGAEKVLQDLSAKGFDVDQDRALVKAGICLMVRAGTPSQTHGFSSRFFVPGP